VEIPKDYLMVIRQWFTGLQKVQRDYLAFRIASLLPGSSIHITFTPRQENGEAEFLQLLDSYINLNNALFPFECKEKQIGLCLCLITIIHFIVFTYESEDFLLDMHNRLSVMPDYIKKQLLKDNPSTQDVLFAYFSSRKQALESWLLLTEEGGKLNVSTIMNKYANS